MKLFKFENAHNYFDDLKIPRLEEYINHVEIGRIDLSEQEREGNIEWEDDGVYLNINGNLQRGFMYIKGPDIIRFGFPKFHVLACKTIEQQRNNGRFHNHYFWSNSPTVVLTDRKTYEEYEDTTLQLCRNCQNQLENATGEYVTDTEDYHNLLNINDQQVENNTNVETDIQGRPLNWMAVSRAYRETKGYICEECSFGGDDLEDGYDRRFIHTHHINPNELTNTHTDNLKSLCVLCHSSQDHHHRQNFDKSSLKFQVLSFVSKYKNILIERENPYISRFLIENKKT